MCGSLTQTAVLHLFRLDLHPFGRHTFLSSLASVNNGGVSILSFFMTFKVHIFCQTSRRNVRLSLNWALLGGRDWNLQRTRCRRIYAILKIQCIINEDINIVVCIINNRVIANKIFLIDHLSSCSGL